MDPRPQQARVRRTAGEAGSAYIAVLLVLVILTILGIAVTFVTQTEQQVGVNERTINRVFYAADAGIETAIARAMVASDHSGTSFLFTDSGQALVAGQLDLGTRVDISAFFPIQEANCNLCEVNNAGTYSGRDYYRVTHAVTVTATRFATMDAGAIADDRNILAQKRLTTMVDIQPWKVAPDAVDHENRRQAGQINDIKF
ncbi:MAG TPA: PilX N-terminal domain-containing pilus assembly protein [Thermoanaerobaculia bacterium]|nr:PilX N-terminal domain-containing pilus assembly protein [Thermoanaerobaculia bacterium]